MNLKVPKNKTAIVIYFVGGASLSGSVFLSHHSPLRYGQEQVGDLLNGPEPFFPVESEETGAIRLIHKRNIVRVASRETPATEEMGKKVNISCVLNDGQILTGDLVIQQPEHKSRVLDFFNSSEGMFFQLGMDSKTLYVNRLHISEILPG